MELIQDIKCTRFFAVKMPEGILTKGESISNYSIGCDLFMPKFTKEFIEAVLASNPQLEFEQKDKVGAFKDKSSHELFMEYNFDNGKYWILRHIQIPTGIAMLIPDDYWVEIRSKSSNFKNNFTIVHGTVDMNYTYGMGAQLMLLNPDRYVVLAEDQKICQIVFHKAVPVLNFSEVKQEDWDNDPEVYKKRTVRVGGFGNRAGTSSIRKLEG